MRKLVLDASVALKWFFQEKNSDLAEILLKQIKKDEIKVFVPQIFFFELVNAVKTKAKSTHKDVLEVINKIFSLKLNSEKVNRKLLAKANFYAQKYDLTIYDASYLALAKVFEINLITADEKLRGKVKLKLIKILR
ncbi:MAG TPA: type II toxin-antitoxin system VapC family toxin [Nevskiaceae bacterium]|nr:type II toxin-antitoxin system VapC family toxin [Nevskiaceae bacterium]